VLVGALILAAVAIFAPKVLVAVVVLFVTLVAFAIGSALAPPHTRRGIGDAQDSGEGDEIPRAGDSARG
jgi:hypothetical protein